jgi:hypothetical protein
MSQSVSTYARKHRGKPAPTSPFHAEHRPNLHHRLAVAFRSGTGREPRPFKRTYDLDDALEYLRGVEKKRQRAFCIAGERRHRGRQYIPAFVFYPPSAGWGA